MVGIPVIQAILEAEAKELQVQVLPEKLSGILFQNKKQQKSQVWYL